MEEELSREAMVWTDRFGAYCAKNLYDTMLVNFEKEGLMEKDEVTMAGLTK